jgi:hypothetical protein
MNNTKYIIQVKHWSGWKTVLDNATDRDGVIFFMREMEKEGYDVRACTNDGFMLVA